MGEQKPATQGDVMLTLLGIGLLLIVILVAVQQPTLKAVNRIEQSLTETRCR